VFKIKEQKMERERGKEGKRERERIMRGCCISEDSNGLCEVVFEKNHLGLTMAELWWGEGTDDIWQVTLLNTTKFRTRNLHEGT
jgi:hypothetical protein